jgi:hypothetical protein
MKKSIFILYLLFVSGSLMADDAWPKPKNSGYFKVAQWWLVANQHYTDQGLIDPNVTNGIYFTNIYGEYGITEKLTGIVYFPFFARSLFNNTVSATTGEILEPGEAINSIGDLDLALRYNLFQKGSTAFSVGLQLGIPLGETAGGVDGVLQTGDGEFNQFLSLEVGQGLQVAAINGWTKAYLGVNNRTEGFSDEFRYGIEAGASILKRKITLIARLYGIESFNNGILASEATGTSIFANNTEHLTISPEIAFHFNDKLGISAGFAKPLSGKLIYANTAYSVGVFYQW